MLICPYCRQDYIWKVHLNSLDMDALMCLECGTVWNLQEAVVDGNGLNFDDFMAKQGQKNDWKTVIKLEQVISSGQA
jgi:hypothetical protein